MSISIYDPTMWDEKTPSNVLGGRNRSKNAVRDQLGRFMPSTVEAWDDWKLDPEHGKKGGLRLLELKGRGYFANLARLKALKSKQS